MNKTQIRILGEFADSQTGPFGSQLHQEDYVDKGTPIVTVEHLGDFGFTTQNLPFVSDNDVKRLKKYTLKEGDIVFSRVGSIDRSVYVRKEQDGWMFSGRCIRVRCNKTINSRYLSFYFKQDNFKKMMLNLAVGATMPSLNTNIMNNVPLHLLPLNTQNKIAKLLNSIEDKIICNNKINTELELLSKTLYDYWFLQFEFPNEEGKPYKSSGGKMIWNEEFKMEIPYGWETGKLIEVANITMGQSPTGDSYNGIGEGSVFYQGRTDFGWRYPFVRLYTTKPSRMAKKGDVLLSVRAPVGDINIANESCCIGRGLAALNSKNNANIYLYYLMKNLKSAFDKRDSNGTTFGSINKDDLYSLSVIKAPISLIEKYQSKVAASDKMISTKARENYDLENIRNFLLPLLMNGQVGFK